MVRTVSIILCLVAIISAMYGFAGIVGAKSAIHEILGVVSWLTFTCALGFGALINLMDKLGKEHTTYLVKLVEHADYQSRLTFQFQG